MVRLIEAKIQSGEYSPGHRLPPERELCDIFGVSRITTRQALAELAQNRLVVRNQGKGTFVARKIESSLLGFFRLSEALKADGRLVSTRVISAQLTLPNEAEAAALMPQPTDQVFKIMRLRFVDGEPYALETSVLLSCRFPGLDHYDFGARSLYDVLTREYATQLVRAREALAPVMLSPAEADLLQVDVAQPALQLTRTTFDSNDVATEVSGALIRGDRCHLLFELWADQRSTARAV